jgi:arginine decarboxylase
MPTYVDHLRAHCDAAGRLNDFIELRNGRLIFAGELDLLEMVERYGAPLEISFCPLITRRVQAMHEFFASARARAGYGGDFVYAYATKANFAEEVVRTAITSGAHYETSSAFDVRIAQRLWQNGVLPPDRFVFCNGSKEQPYIDAILYFRQAGFANIVPILDDPDEFEALAACAAPLLLGVRERKDAGDMAEGATYGYDRFGMTPAELAALAKRVAGTPHQLILYHAMVGSQLEDRAFWSKEVIESLDSYAQLRTIAPSLAYFDFGGGMPTGAYSLDFQFDYGLFAEQLQHDIGAWCDTRGIPHPHLVGEFGRYSVADHGLHIFGVGKVKPGQPGQPPWYLLNGSIMVALPDILIVKGQHFVTLPLNHLDAEAGPVVLGGRRTCDSDDFYPRGDLELILPLLQTSDWRLGIGGWEKITTPPSPQSPVPNPQPLLIAVFGTGAYQAMLAGEGGAHHCLAPEASKVIIEARAGSSAHSASPGQSALVTRVIGEQSWADVLGELGYQ